MARPFAALLLALAACDGGKADTFKADQPRVGRLFPWDGFTVADADRFYRLDVDEERAVPIDVPGLHAVSQLAMRGTTPLALGQNGTRRVLMRRDRNAWSEIPLPEAFSGVDIPLRLAADDAAMLLWSVNVGAWSEDGREWRRLACPRLVEGSPSHVLKRGDEVYLGYDRGEWGGALIVVDLENGTHDVLDHQLPVRQLSVDAKGRVWAVEGLDHVRPGQGILRILENGAWSVFAQVGSGGRPAVNWTLPPMSFDAMDVDAQGHPWVLGSGVGAARWDGTSWSMATGEWPRHRFNGELYKVSGSGLRLHNATIALIALGESGIAVWDGRRTRRIALNPR